MQEAVAFAGDVFGWNRYAGTGAREQAHLGNALDDDTGEERLVEGAAAADDAVVGDQHGIAGAERLRRLLTQLLMLTRRDVAGAVNITADDLSLFLDDHRNRLVAARERGGVEGVGVQDGVEVRAPQIDLAVHLELRRWQACTGQDHTRVGDGDEILAGQAGVIHAAGRDDQTTGHAGANVAVGADDVIQLDEPVTDLDQLTLHGEVIHDQRSVWVKLVSHSPSHRLGNAFRT